MENDKIQKGFERALLLEIEDIESLYAEPKPSRRRIDPASDREAFDRSRDRGATVDFETPGQYIDVSAAQAQVIDALYSHLDKVVGMVQELNDPRSENSLNRFLARIERPDSYGAGLSEKLTKHIVKAAVALATLKEELSAVLGREDVITRKLEALDAV